MSEAPNVLGIPLQSELMNKTVVFKYNSSAFTSPLTFPIQRPQRQALSLIFQKGVEGEMRWKSSVEGKYSSLPQVMFILTWIHLLCYNISLPLHVCGLNFTIYCKLMLAFWFHVITQSWRIVLVHINRCFKYEQNKLHNIVVT